MRRIQPAMLSLKRGGSLRGQEICQPLVAGNGSKVIAGKEPGNSVLQAQENEFCRQMNKQETVFFTLCSKKGHSLPTP